MAGSESGKTARSTVPAQARTLVALLNSRPHAVPELPDKLDDPRQAGEILGAYGESGADPVPDDRLALVRSLRSDLMAVVEAVDAEETSRGWEAVTARISDAAFRLTLSEDGPGLRQSAGDPLIGRIASSVADLVRDGVWSRIRVCGNEGCRAVFYDTTRSRTQRWHSYELCGNRANVAAYRARRSTSQAAAGPSA